MDYKAAVQNYFRNNQYRERDCLCWCKIEIDWNERRTVFIQFLFTELEDGSINILFEGIPMLAEKECKDEPIIDHHCINFKDWKQTYEIMVLKEKVIENFIKSVYRSYCSYN